MKPLLLLVFILSIFLSACQQPVASSTLLVSGSSATSTDSTTIDDGSDNGTGALEIKADNDNITVNLEDSDKAEISGSCVDQNRKENRILVEVFGGEDLNANPYVQNETSFKCLAANGSATGVGLAVDDSCFFIAKGTGLVETDNNGVIQKYFPQCHNGRFSFIVKLGAALTNNSVLAGQRYRVRMKLRSGKQSSSTPFADSPWYDRVFINRKLSPPPIEKVTASASSYTCKLDMLPARFNQSIAYTLARTQVDVSGTTVPVANLFGPINTSNTDTFSFLDKNDIALSGRRIVAGATYNYTLTSQDLTVYAAPFVYAAPLTATSVTTSCAIDKPTIVQTQPPTNAPVSGGGFGPTCYFGYASTTNPDLNFGGQSFVSLRWAYSTRKGWSAGGTYNNAVPNLIDVNLSSCNSTACTAKGAGAAGPNDNLAASTVYYYAVQEEDRTFTAPYVFRGKWSEEVECKTPQ